MESSSDSSTGLRRALQNTLHRTLEPRDSSSNHSQTPHVEFSTELRRCRELLELPAIAPRPLPRLCRLKETLADAFRGHACASSDARARVNLGEIPLLRPPPTKGFLPSFVSRSSVAFRRSARFGAGARRGVGARRRGRARASWPSAPTLYLFARISVVSSIRFGLLKSSNDSHVSCGISKHHRSSKARHCLNSSQNPTIRSTKRRLVSRSFPVSDSDDLMVF